MPHFSQFGYRFFALLLILMATGCSPLPEDTEEEPPSPHQIAAATVNGGDTPPLIPNNAPAQNTPPTASVQPATSANDYAPPTNMGADKSPGSSVPRPPGSPAVTAANAPVVKVALLIPITGESAELGRSLLDAAVMAVYDKYSILSPRDITAKVQLLPEDTSDTIEGAEKATQDAVQQGATLILGPVFGKQVSIVAGIARPKNIPVITFSNNAAVAGNGVYLFGFIPEQQVNRIVQYAVSRKITNVSALVPSTPYGAAIVKQLSVEMRKGGGRAYPIEYYAEDMSALENNIGRLTRFLQDDNNRNQALFIAEGGPKLKTLVDALLASGLKPGSVQLLGTGLWDDKDVLQWPGLYGGWFASSPPEKYQSFEQHFIATYNYRPDRRASLSYDAVALAATLAISSANGFTAAMITDPIGFSGPANGIFRFHEDGTIERGLCVLTVTPAGFKTVEPSPTAFSQ